MTRVVNNLLAATHNKIPSVLLSLDISATFNTWHPRSSLSYREHKKSFWTRRHSPRMAQVILNRSFSIHVCWRRLLYRGGDDIGRSSRFGPRAAPVLHVHCPCQNIDQLLQNKLPPVRRRHVTVHRHQPQFSALLGINDIMCRCSNRLEHQERPSTLPEQNRGTRCQHSSAGG